MTALTKEKEDAEAQQKTLQTEKKELTTQVTSLTKDQEEAAAKIKELTEENEQLKKATDYNNLDEETLTDTLIEIAEELEKLGYKLSLNKETVNEEPPESRQAGSFQTGDKPVFLAF